MPDGPQFLAATFSNEAERRPYKAGSPSGRPVGPSVAAATAAGLHPRHQRQDLPQGDGLRLQGHERWQSPARLADAADAAASPVSQVPLPPLRCWRILQLPAAIGCRRVPSSTQCQALLSIPLLLGGSIPCAEGTRPMMVRALVLLKNPPPVP